MNPDDLSAKLRRAALGMNARDDETWLKNLCAQALRYAAVRLHEELVGRADADDARTLAVITLVNLAAVKP